MTGDDLVRRLATYGIAACAIVVLTTAAYAFARARFAGSSPTTAGYAVGDRIDVPESIYASAPHTLVIFARSRCGVCQREQPVLKRFIASLGGPPRVAIAMISGTDDPDADGAYARALGLGDRALTLLDLKRLRVGVVPVVALVNRSGTVEYVHTGALSPAVVEELTRTVLSLSPDR